MINMDRAGYHMLSTEYCHFEGKHNHCKNLLTITASVYHPVLHRMVELAIMKCNLENLVLFWNLFNEVLHKESGNEDAFFYPSGLSAMKQEQNWASFKSVFGEEVLQRTKGSELHYLQSLHIHTNTLNSRKSKNQFKKLEGGGHSCRFSSCS